jgi:hypothetical protein
MKVQHRLLQLLTSAALLVGGDAPLGFAQETPCLQQVRSGVQPGVWETIKHYFASLSLTSEATRSRSRLIQLRANIVNLESAKTQLVEIIEAHINSRASGAEVSNDLRLSTIPDALDRIETITKELTWIARDGDMFAAENSFKELILNLDIKRATTLCKLAEQAKAPTPNLPVMTTLVQQLKDELRAISAAEEALGKYIRESHN